jgi:DedD protein
MMETAVKERLVGAAVLVVLVVLVVPALLSGPPGPAQPDAAEDSSNRTVEIDIAQPGAAGGRVAEAPAASAGALPAPSELPPSTPGAPAPAAAGELPAGPQRTLADAGVKPAAAQPAAAGWAVQVAALSSADSARGLVADLKRRGYKAFALEHRSAGKVLYRVRVGPEAERESAAALAARLQGEGFKATVVTQP